MSMRYSRMISRRGFCTCGLALGVTGRWLGPAEAYVEARDLVDVIRDAAATAPLKTHKLRGDVAVIEGSGGNIAVLTGPDGKVLIDAGITATRPRIMDTINNLGRSNQASDQHPLALRSYGWQPVAECGGSRHPRARKYAQTSFVRAAR